MLQACCRVAVEYRCTSRGDTGASKLEHAVPSNLSQLMLPQHSSIGLQTGMVAAPFPVVRPPYAMYAIWPQAMACTLKVILQPNAQKHHMSPGCKALSLIVRLHSMR